MVRAVGLGEMVGGDRVSGRQKLKRFSESQGTGRQHRTWRRALPRPRLLSSLCFSLLPRTEPSLLTVLRRCGVSQSLGDSPLHVVIVAGVMPLQLLLHVVQHDHGRDEIHRLARGEQVQVVPAVSAPVPVASGLSKDKTFFPLKS